MKLLSSVWCCVVTMCVGLVLSETIVSTDDTYLAALKHTQEADALGMAVCLDHK